MAEKEDERRGKDRRLAERTGTRSFSPFQEMDSIFEDLDRTLDRFFGRPFRERKREGRRAPALDMRDLGDRYMIEAEIPGIDKDDIEIELRDEGMVIEGETTEETEEEGEDYLRKERGYRSFYRRLPIPEQVEQDEITAELDRGVLTIDLPKKETEVKEGKKIDIE
ncbi:MAG: Hsp20/alpha crystallin family protein [Candidatus Thermoplasmatota archaeon]|nr:Hsp20/alpha crystallin family protein [Candidatus Thermoplasmatota archaeon]MBS3790813.1 Hsp20/alpha crystallin family protein [Candidatus Thermoplasmatota archaeon]